MDENETVEIDSESLYTLLEEAENTIETIEDGFPVDHLEDAIADAREALDLERGDN